MDIDEKSKILMFGATGYLGKYLVKASLSMAHPTYAYIRPVTTLYPSKIQLLTDFQSSGVIVYQGELDEHEKLVSALKQVDVVISALAVPQHLDQLKIIRAIKEAGNKRILWSAVWNYEKDVAIYTLKAANDPRVANRVLICRPPKSIVSQLDLVAAWEQKTGRTIKRTHVLGEEIIQLSQNLLFPENIPVAILHNIFVAVSQLSFELTDNDLEASKLYPDHNYTSIDDLLNQCLVDPPKTKLAAFA